MNQPNVPVDAIGKSAPERPGVPGPIGPDPLTRDPVLDQHLGRVGMFIGGGPEKAGNIAYAVIFAAFFVLVVSASSAALVGSEKLAAIFGNLVAGCFSLITGALGFLFGKSGKE